MATCTYSQPASRIRSARMPVTRGRVRGDATQFFNVQMQQIAGPQVLIALDRLARLEIAQTAELGGTLGGGICAHELSLTNGGL